MLHCAFVKTPGGAWSSDLSPSDLVYKSQKFTKFGIIRRCLPFFLEQGRSPVCRIVSTCSTCKSVTKSASNMAVAGHFAVLLPLGHI